MLSRKYKNIALYILITLSFFPYISKTPPIRIYSISLYILILILFLTGSIKSKTISTTILPFAALFCCGIATIFNNETLESIRIIASLERLTSWIAAILIVISLETYLTEQLKIIAKIFCSAISLNAAIQILQALGLNTIIINNFYFSDYNSSTAYNAATNGRFLGIFNQPIELGIGTTLALFLLIIAEPFKNKLLYIIIAVIIIISGILTVSKIFILLGLPLASLIYIRKYGTKIFFKLSIPAIALVVIFTTLLSNYWSGFEYFARFFDASNYDNFIEFTTASRFSGENTDVEKLFSEVFNHSPIIGFGLGSTRLLDNGFLEFYYQGGTLSLTFYCLFLLKILSTSFTFQGMHIKIQHVKLVIFLFVTLCNIGSPVFTIWFISIPLFSLIYSPLTNSKHAKQ